MDNRAMGLEHELALQFEPGYIDVDNPPTDTDLACALLKRVAPTIRNSMSVWMPNGSRFYVDMGNFLEAATSECVELRDLIAVSEANLIYTGVMGDEEDVVPLKETDTPALFPWGKIRAYNVNQDWLTYNTRGTHENYQIFKRQVLQQMNRERLFPENNMEILRYIGTKILPFLVVRQLFTGNGGLLRDRPNSATYTLSQRACFMRTDFNHQSTGNGLRPIVNLRDEPLSALEDFLRFHIISGDANMSQYARWLKTGTTSMVLSLIENGYTPNITLEQPVWDIHFLTRDLTGRKYKLKTKEGNTLTAPEILYQYCGAMHRLMAEHPNPLYWEVLDEFTNMVSKLIHNDAIELTDTCDHALKYALLQKSVFEKGFKLESDAAIGAHMKYHQLGKNNLFVKWAKRKNHRFVVSTDEVQKFYGLVSSTPNTRARERKRLLYHFRSLDRNTLSSWEKIVVGERKADCTDNYPANSFEIFLPDPRNSSKIYTGE